MLDRATMAIPNFKLSWHDLKYSIKVGGKEKEKLSEGESRKYILKGVSGFARNNETCFIMGSSGAGKTTLLNALSDRIENSGDNQVEGDVLINESKKVRQKDFG